MCPETDHVSNDHSLAPLRSGRLPSQSRTYFPADSDEKGRGGVLRFVILGTTVGVRLDLIAFRSNLQWWAEFSQEWNGISRMTQDPHISPQPIIISDASGNWGCGAFNLDLDWFQLQWPNSWSTLHITVKELAPIVIACAVWGKRWQGKSIHCVCDNAAVVSIVTSGSSRDATVMHLMWCLFFFQAVFSLSYFIRYTCQRNEK